MRKSSSSLGSIFSDRNKVILGFGAITAGLLYWSYKTGKLDSLLGVTAPMPLLGPGSYGAPGANVQAPLQKFMTSPSSSPVQKPTGKSSAIPAPIAMSKVATRQIQGTLEQEQAAFAAQQAQEQAQAQAHPQAQYQGSAAVAPSFSDWMHSNELAQTQATGWGGWY